MEVTLVAPPRDSKNDSVFFSYLNSISQSHQINSRNFSNVLNEFTQAA
ncbi:hypothetical protein [Cytobacillus luteolus]|nr:hypothetical protein [Cytobacillus luteolus]